MERSAAAYPAYRGLSLGAALLCAAYIGYLVGSDHVGPGRAGFVVMFSGMLVGALQDFVTWRWARFVVIPALSVILLVISAVMLVRAHVM